MAKDEKATLMQGTLDMLILKSLLPNSRHGYGIARWIQACSRDLLAVEEGSLYPALHRMEKKGWIQAEWGLSESNRRAKYYQLTPQGKTQLQKEVAQWNSLSQAIRWVLEAQVQES